MDKTRNAEASVGRDAPPQQLPELPEDVLLNILGRIPVQPRLRSCTPVCSAWAAAAVKAPSALEVHLEDPAHWQQLQGWLANHGDHVTQLVLCGPEPHLQVQLPCARLTSLQELHMTDMHVDMLQQQVGSSSTAPPNSSLLPALRELHLESCSLSCEGLRQLSRLSSLADLHLEHLTCSDLDSTRQLLPQALRDVLQQTAPRLARLHLTGLREPTYVDLGSTTVKFGAAALSPLSGMQQLQQATFSGKIFTTDCLQHLPTSLTSLAFEGAARFLGGHGRLSLTRAAWPQLQQHTCLQELRLNSVCVQPSVLPLLAGSLRRLWLDDVWPHIITHRPRAADVPGVDDIDEDEENGLLRALGSLTQLQELETRNQRFGLFVEHSDTQHMSALTASSQLRRLTVHDDFDGEVPPRPLPTGAIQHMFPAGRQLPHLRELQLHGNITLGLAKSAVPHVGGLEPNIIAHDVTSMVGALPALDNLVLVNVLYDEKALMQLTALQPSLTSLTVGGSYMGDDDEDVFLADPTIRHLARLTTLQDLTVDHTFVTTMGLLHLTALRHLTRLEVHDAPQLEACVCNVTCHHTLMDDFNPDEYDCWPNGSINSDGGTHNALVLHASAEDQARGVPPVWMQLRDRCERDSKCRQALEAAH